MARGGTNKRKRGAKLFRVRVDFSVDFGVGSSRRRVSGFLGGPYFFLAGAAAVAGAVAGLFAARACTIN